LCNALWKTGWNRSQDPRSPERHAKTDIPSPAADFLRQEALNADCCQSIAALALLLAAIGLAAAFPPVWRAASIDPVQTLRME
jgi:hypothetical protein